MSRQIRRLRGREAWEPNNELLAHLTGICPKCGDGGWWIDDLGKHVCDCPAGIEYQGRSATESGRGGDKPQE